MENQKPLNRSSQLPQLFLIPFAGGNCYSYQFLKNYLPDYECITLELPGRGRRMDAPFIKDFDTACADIFSQLKKNISSNRFLIYGHSMGAMITLKVTALLESINIKPDRIIVTGSPGPGVYNERLMYQMEDIEFKRQLKLIGGISDEILQNSQLFDYYAPILRADFEVLEKNIEMTFFPPVTVPVYAVMGFDEDHSTEITNWAKFTKNTFSSKVLSGNHFFIHENAAEIARIINLAYL